MGFITEVFGLLLSDTIVVDFSFQLVQLLSVDEKSQTIKTIVWNSYVSFILFWASDFQNIDIG